MSYLIDGDVCSSCLKHIGMLWQESGCCPECGSIINIPRVKPYICKISGKVCPYDDWDFMTGCTGGLSDNCPIGRYTTNNGKRDSHGFMIVSDWCIHLKPNVRYEKFKKKIQKGKVHELKPETIEDIINVPPAPKLHDIRVDLYWCARGRCDECSRKQIKLTIGDVPEPGGCRHDLLDEANDYYLAPLDH